MRRLLRPLLLVVALGFMAAAFVEARGRVEADLLPAPVRLAAAALLLTANLVVSCRAWTGLLDDSAASRPKLAHGFYLSQLGKYVPGGIWQVAGQVGSATQAGIGVARASTVFTVFAVVQLVAAAAFGSALAATGQWIGLAGLAGLPLLDRRWMAWSVGKLPRRVDPAMVPEQHRILRAAAVSFAGFAMASVSFAVLMNGMASEVGFVEAATAWSFAWAVGFAAVVFPSGLGVREGVLLFLLSGVPGRVVIAASLWHRLAAMAADALVILGAKARDYTARRRA